MFLSAPDHLELKAKMDWEHQRIESVLKIPTSLAHTVIKNLYTKNINSFVHTPPPPISKKKGKEKKKLELKCQSSTVADESQ